MLSIVIPLFNEEKSLQELYINIIKDVIKIEKEYEIIFIDDGSIDGSLEVLKNLKRQDRNVRIFSFRKNQGKAESLSLGFSKARGDYIATLDADLQDKPLDIPNLLEKAKEGWDVVCGWRKNRQDSFFKIFSSKIFNFLTKVFWKIKLHDYNCGLKVYTKESAKSLNLYGGLHRFIPLLAYQQGFKVTEIVVEHGKRKFGKSKYGISKLWKDLPDIFTMLFLSRYGKKPLHFFGIVGAFFLFTGVVISIYLTIVHFQGYSIGTRPLLFLGMLLISSGFQIILTGFLADLIMNISYKNGGDSIRREQFELKYMSE